MWVLIDVVCDVVKYWCLGLELNWYVLWWGILSFLCLLILLFGFDFGCVCGGVW